MCIETTENSVMVLKQHYPIEISNFGYYGNCFYLYSPIQWPLATWLMSTYDVASVTEGLTFYFN